MWTELSSVAAASAIERDIDDPDDTFYLAYGGGVLKSVDGGQSWTPYGYAPRGEVDPFCPLDSQLSLSDIGREVNDSLPHRP